ncbi:hypothetical protein AB3Y40_01320 [Yoonia sp. R2331]|uniref:hypothetical protein n=1 Tax=Yoonia sp. R2331 TaxID=3237238 RepID=UPI0034E5DCF5
MLVFLCYVAANLIAEPLMRVFLTILFTSFATLASAQTFQLSLGSGTIGTMTVTGDSIRANVTDSPLGLANGAFTATAKRVQMTDGRVVTQYLSDTPRKGRKISVLSDKGQVIETTVSPSDDRTDLSDPAAVPGAVSTPVAVLNGMINATGCPGAMRFYDGRRVITLSPTGSTQTGAMLSCDMSYRVTAGPGHLSPLYIKNATMEVTYDTAAGQSLTEIQIGNGPFTLYVTR